MKGNEVRHDGGAGRHLSAPYHAARIAAEHRALPSVIEGAVPARAAGNQTGGSESALRAAASEVGMRRSRSDAALAHARPSASIDPKWCCISLVGAPAAWALQRIVAPLTPDSARRRRAASPMRALAVRSLSTRDSPHATLQPSNTNVQHAICLYAIRAYRHRVQRLTHSAVVRRDGVTRSALGAHLACTRPTPATPGPSSDAHHRDHLDGAVDPSRHA